MKNIVHISNFNLMRLKGCFQNGFPIKISNGLIRNGYSVLNYPDRDLCRMFGFGHMNFWGKRKLNAHLINYCKTVKPDALLIGHADLIEAETILKIKEMFPQLRIMQWSCDWIVPGYAERNIVALHKYLGVVDVLMISTGDRRLLRQFKRPHNKVAYLPNMADNSIETNRSFEHETLPYDIMLCTNTGKRQFCGEDEEIEQIIDEASARVPGLKWLLAGLKGKRNLNGYEYIEALGKAAMGLNLSRLNDIYLYSSDRLAHIMADGQLAFIDRRNGFTDLFEEDEAAFYETREEFFDKLWYFKESPQQRMKTARKGWEKIHTEYNERTVTKFMADLLFDKFKPEGRPWQIIIED